MITQQFPQARFPAFSGPGRLQSDRTKAGAGPLVLLFMSGGKRSDTNVLKDSSIVALLTGSFASLLSDPFAFLLAGLFVSLLVTCSCFALLFKAHFLHEVVRHAIRYPYGYRAGGVPWPALKPAGLLVNGLAGFKTGQPACNGGGRL